MNKVTIAGLGLRKDELTFGTAELMKNAGRLILHTGRIGAAEWLNENGIAFETLDELYESSDDFDEHAQKAAEYVKQAAKERDVVYGVIDLRDESVTALLNDNDIDCRAVAGVPSDGYLTGYISGGIVCASASDHAGLLMRADTAMLIREIDSAVLASEVKLRLNEVYPADSDMLFLYGEDNITKCKLEDLDRMSGYDHRCCALIYPAKDITCLENYTFAELSTVIEQLCSRKGSLSAVGESYEKAAERLKADVLNMITSKNACVGNSMTSELLTDIMLMIKAGEKHGGFGINDTVSIACDDLIRGYLEDFK